MQIGIVGLGRMGGNMARRIARGGAPVIAFDRDAAARDALTGEKHVQCVDSLAALVARLTPPRVIWLMLPAGAPTAQTLAALSPSLARGDVIVDGANAHYKDSIVSAQGLAVQGLQFVDAGVSGGIWGLEQGYTIMMGGDPAAVARVLPFVRLLAPAPDRGWLHCGHVGAGHYAKMVHNGIEYGLMQAYAEGFALLEAKRDLSIDTAAVAECWRHGSVVRSWLLDLTAGVLREGPAALEAVAPYVADSGEGRWSLHEALDLGVPAPVMSAAVSVRLASQGKGNYAARLLAKMRQAFGGHAVKAP